MDVLPLDPSPQPRRRVGYSKGGQAVVYLKNMSCNFGGDLAREIATSCWRQKEAAGKAR